MDRVGLRDMHDGAPVHQYKLTDFHTIWHKSHSYFVWWTGMPTGFIYGRHQLKIVANLRSQRAIVIR